MLDCLLFASYVCQTAIFISMGAQDSSFLITAHSLFTAWPYSYGHCQQYLVIVSSV